MEFTKEVKRFLAKFLLPEVFWRFQGVKNRTSAWNGLSFPTHSCLKYFKKKFIQKVTQSWTVVLTLLITKNKRIFTTSHCYLGTLCVCVDFFIKLYNAHQSILDIILFVARAFEELMNYFLWIHTHKNTHTQRCSVKSLSKEFHKIHKKLLPVKWSLFRKLAGLPPKTLLQVKSTTGFFQWASRNCIVYHRTITVNETYFCSDKYLFKTSKVYT